MIYIKRTLGKEDIILWPCSVNSVCCKNCPMLNQNNYKAIGPI